MGQKFLPASVHLGFVTEQHRLGGSRVTEMHFSQLWRLEPKMKAFFAGPSPCVLTRWQGLL